MSFHPYWGVTRFAQAPTETKLVVWLWSLHNPHSVQWRPPSKIIRHSFQTTRRSFKVAAIVFETRNKKTRWNQNEEKAWSAWSELHTFCKLSQPTVSSGPHLLSNLAVSVDLVVLQGVAMHGAMSFGHYSAVEQFAEGTNYITIEMRIVTNYITFYPLKHQSNTNSEQHSHTSHTPIQNSTHTVGLCE